ncbi:MAG TPA: serine/threonine protein kinase [Vicinamibacteria bacterium]|nr:serine/threonine protein kinase [Vicinamibacteria bacterium]
MEKGAGGDGVDHTVVQDDAERARSKDRSEALPRPEVPGYEMERQLGAGSYGEVWLAIHKNTGRRVAIKFFSRFKGLDWPLLKREVGKLVEVVSERRVVHLLHVGWDADPPYYVMEFLSGGSLADRLSGRTLPVRDTVAVVREVAEALVYLHGKAILHCDLKPANVLLDDRGQIRLADFGQARLSSEAGPAVGTLFYMAPEQAEAGARPDVRSDIYSLGALAYTMLTGKPPYARASGSEGIASSGSTQERIERYKKLIDDSPSPSEHHRVEGIDRAFAALVDRCLEKDPARRFENVPQVLESLAVRDRRTTRKPLVVLGLLGPLALLMAFAGVGLWARHQAVSRATSALTEQTLESAEGYAELIAAVVDRNLSAVKRQVERETKERDVVHLMQRGDADAKSALQGRTDALYESYRDRHIHNWVVADANAVVLARTPFDERVVGSRYAYREWFSGIEDVAPEKAPSVAIPRADTGITLAFESTAAGRPLLVSVASPIWSEDRTRVLGVLAATVHLATFNDWIADAEGPKDDTGCPDRFAVLLNRGQLVRHPCPADSAAKLPLGRGDYFEAGAVSRLVSSEIGRSDSYLDPLRAGRSHFAASTRFRENPDWMTIVEHDRILAMSPITSLSESFGTLAWLAAGFGLAVVVGLWALLYRLIREEPTGTKRKDVLSLGL